MPMRALMGLLVSLGFATPMAAQSPPSVSVLSPQETSLTQRVSVLGEIVAAQEVQIQAELAGLKIEEILAEAGDVVSQGQILARLSQESFALRREQIEARRLANAASIAQAEALLIEARGAAVEARRAAERAELLAAQGSSPQATADTARAAAEAAEARRHSAEQSVRAAQAQNALLETEERALDLDAQKAILRAPQNGRLLTRSAQLGALTSLSAPALFTLAAEAAYHVSLDLSSSDLAALRQGATLSLADGTALPLRRQAAQIDAQTRLGTIEAALPGQDHIVGEILSVDLTLPSKPALTLPHSALLYEDGPHVLRLTADNRTERVEVRLGARSGAWVEVQGGLTAQDRIIARAGGFLRAGDTVMPIEAAQ